MSIALICHASLGGSSRVATRLAYGLERRGHAVSLIAASPPPAPAKELSAVRLETFESDANGWTTVIEPTWEPRRLDALSRCVEAVVRRNGIEMVHYHYAWPFAHLVPRLKARLGASAPAFVGTLHGTDVTHPPAGASPAVLDETDVVTCVSHRYARLARARLGLATDPVVIPNFVDPGDFPRSRDFTHPCAGRRRPRLVHVSNFRRVKNPDDVGRIFLALRERLDAELWLVGEGPELGSLASMLRAAGAGADVRLLGYQEDIGRVLARCDLLLMASAEESFCLAALEAMTSGLCVVAPAVGGLTELAEHGRSAMLFEPGDIAGGARAALRLLTQHRLRLAMRSHAAERANRFSTWSVLQRYEALYRAAAPEELRLAQQAV